MHSYVHTYLKRDDYFRKFQKNIQDSIRNIVANPKSGMDYKNARKHLKRQVWKVVKQI